MNKIGIIGLGDMGKNFAKGLCKNGFIVSGSDLPKNIRSLHKEFKDSTVTITSDSNRIARESDILLFAVETQNLESVVKSVANDISAHTIVGGLTSVKTPEVEIFEKYLLPQTPIVTLHPMHGPTVNPCNQPAMLINHRGTQSHVRYLNDILQTLSYRVIPVRSAQEHDRITANVQAATHTGFQAMGTAWMRAGFFPWMNETYSNGVDTVKYLMMLRIFSGKPHVYSSIAFTNPQAHEQILQYQKSCNKLFEMMRNGNEKKLQTYLQTIQQSLFDTQTDPIIHLEEEVLDKVCLTQPVLEQLPNSHLSLLAMADTWYTLGINPYEHMICQTPPFKLRLGLVEQVFRDNALLDTVAKTTMHNPIVLKHDKVFVDAVSSWVDVVSRQNLQEYDKLFLQTQIFFSSHLDEGKNKSSDLIKYFTN